jgi:type II secretory pathway component GspD/PulD (secretin)
MIDLQHRDAADLAKQVNGLLQELRRVGGDEKTGPPGLSVTSDPRTNQVVVVATEDAEGDVAELIRTLDMPTGALTRTYRFQNVSPQRVDKLVRETLSPEGAGSYRATVDAESGLLVVTAPPAVHEKIEALKRELDVAAPGEEGYIRFYKLMNTSAADVLATIRALEGQEGGLFSLPVEGAAGTTEIPRALREELSTGPNVPPGPPGLEVPKPPAYRPPASETPKAAAPSGGGSSAASPPPPTYPTPVRPSATSSSPTAGPPLSSVPGGPGAREPGAPVHPSIAGTVARTRNAIVAVDHNTNSLIVAAPPAVQRIYKQLIDALDKRRPQVMIEVTMVTLDTSSNFSLGVELSGGRQRDDLRWLTFGSFGLSTMNLATGVPTLIPGAGFNGIILDPDGVNVVLRALATSGRAKVLSAPRILVNDNSTGTLSSVAEAPFTSVNASTTVATTSFAGYASAGTTVAVTPHISQDDYLRLGYSLTLNSFTGAGAGGVPPPRQTNTVDSEVVVPDGHTIVVGGLKRQDVSETLSKIPFLGDIPGLGYLFSSISKTATESSLFIFIRPVILRDDQFRDLRYLSDLDAERAEIAVPMPESRPMPMR